MNSNERDHDSFEANVNTARIDMNEESDQSMFAASNLVRKTSDNLTKSEASADEKPLWTEKTDELEEREEADELEEDNDNEELETDEEEQTEYDTTEQSEETDEEEQ